MKSPKLFVICLISLFGLSNLLAQPVKLWETKDIYKAPESVAFDSARGCIYVSNYTHSLKNGNSYGNDCVSKADLNGQIIKFDFNRFD